MLILCSSHFFTNIYCIVKSILNLLKCSLSPTHSLVTSRNSWVIVRSVGKVFIYGNHTFSLLVDVGKCHQRPKYTLLLRFITRRYSSATMYTFLVLSLFFLPLLHAERYQTPLEDQEDLFLPRSTALYYLCKRKLADRLLLNISSCFSSRSTDAAISLSSLGSERGPAGNVGRTDCSKTTDETDLLGKSCISCR